MCGSLVLFPLEIFFCLANNCSMMLCTVSTLSIIGNRSEVARCTGSLPHNSASFNEMSCLFNSCLNSEGVDCSKSPTFRTKRSPAHTPLEVKTTKMCTTSMMFEHLNTNYLQGDAVQLTTVALPADKQESQEMIN